MLFWLGFYVVYQVARGLADRDVTTAFWNGLHVIRIEQWTGTLFEPTIQGFVDSSELLIKATTYTYWLSQFVVVGATLLWVYFRHHDRFAGFRNWLIAREHRRARLLRRSSRRRRRGCSRRGASSTRSRSTRASTTEAG